MTDLSAKLRELEKKRKLVEEEIGSYNTRPGLVRVGGPMDPWSGRGGGTPGVRGRGSTGDIRDRLGARVGGNHGGGDRGGTRGGLDRGGDRGASDRRPVRDVASRLGGRPGDRPSDIA